MSKLPDYGLWQLVIINSVIFLVFVFSFFKPQTRRDWRTFGTFAAFIAQCLLKPYVLLYKVRIIEKKPTVKWFLPTTRNN